MPKAFRNWREFLDSQNIMGSQRRSLLEDAVQVLRMQGEVSATRANEVLAYLQGRVESDRASDAATVLSQPDGEKEEIFICIQHTLKRLAEELRAEKERSQNARSRCEELEEQVILLQKENESLKRQQGKGTSKRVQDLEAKNLDLMKQLDEKPDHLVVRSGPITGEAPRKLKALEDKLLKLLASVANEPSSSSSAAPITAPITPAIKLKDDPNIASTVAPSTASPLSSREVLPSALLAGDNVPQFHLKPVDTGSHSNPVEALAVNEPSAADAADEWTSASPSSLWPDTNAPGPSADVFLNSGEEWPTNSPVSPLQDVYHNIFATDSNPEAPATADSEQLQMEEFKSNEAIEEEQLATFLALGQDTPLLEAADNFGVQEGECDITTESLVISDLSQNTFIDYAGVEAAGPKNSFNDISEPDNDGWGLDDCLC
eukprot:Platyproteum_vivax@DN3164_c0_g1_i2.p1